MLNDLFNPKSIAVIGASNTEGKVGYDIFANLKKDYKGKLYPVNLKATNVQGVHAYKNISKIKDTIDLAVIVIPSKFVPQTILEIAKKKTKNIIIITAGFSETSKDGKKLEEQIQVLVKKYKLNIVGPNCLGVINTSNGMNASFAANSPLKGNIALLSQSGAICTAILDWATKEQIGFSKFISLGNKSFLDDAHYFEYLAKDKETEAVFVYMESVKNHETFLEAARKLSSKKPVILIKAGRSKSGKKAASSHTGAMSEDDKIFTIVCKKANILRVNSTEGFFDMAKLVYKLPACKGTRLGIITNAGGPGVIVSDSAEHHKFELPEFTEKTIDLVTEINPVARNPLDLLGDALPRDYQTALEALQKERKIDLIYLILTPQSMTNPLQVAKEIVELNKNPENKKPVIVSFIGGEQVNGAKQHMRQNGVVEFETPERGIKALARLRHYLNERSKTKVYSVNKKKKQKIVKMLKHKNLTMEQAYKIFKEFEIQIPKTIFFSNYDEAKIKLEKSKLKFPLVLKGDIAEIAHKTEHKLITVGIHTNEQLKKEINRMNKIMKDMNYSSKFLLQELIQGKETIVSFITTKFGKVVTYGLGGIFVEVMKDFSQTIAPLSKEEINEMVDGVKGTKVLLGARTKNKYDIKSLKKTIDEIADIAAIYDEIDELEINPLIITENGCYAADAVLTTKK